ncbi:replication endonuclease [Cronobacter sakazakii]|uniref:replication endonuclease n=1 Tax=Cronobacter sakazakii TaxID=28141 RepID=UPI0015EF86AD|nr:replication endonuclease [Cronobacter sakazakii]EJP5811817.1 replication endonuclease [Cronobacter sakazakii]EJX4169095.1 replication endonuclease [Cronobacter sakazakii]EJY8354940.1 replication endonuclease [Cronobacter sakazakii]EJY8377599.1 replication endonuclease [Cronobacter sakazakii]EKC5756462.1 replication endonuclease [Cronobacter sakazakii]
MSDNVLSVGNHHAVDTWRREHFARGVPRDVTLTERKLWQTNPVDHDFRAQYLHEIPDWLAGYFGHRYEALFNGSDGRRRANTFLRQTIGQNVLPRLRKVSERYRMRADESDLPFGKALARLPSLDRREVKELSAKVASWMAQSFYEFTDTLKGKPKDEKEMRQRTYDAYIRLSDLATFIGFTAPYWATFQADKLTVRQAECGLLRMMAPAWWYAKIKRARDVQREHMAIAVGQVQKAASAYVSRSALNEWTEQKRRNAEFFKKFDLINEDGDRVSLADKVYGSVANPAIRRCELMVRMRGFEDIASETGMVGDFYTITAPSRYHSVHSKGGFVSQWNGYNPQDTQRYLCGVWAKARAALSRAGIHVFGFRVVEPHHDGTPHWHMLLFMRPQDVDAVRDIICYHARISDSEELNTPEALKARFFVEPIDPEIGSATGYIAKYISKNIDGFALDDEKDGETGESLRDMAKAVSAWASRWRIRQFQQIGGAPVTVWRELRRLRGQQLADPRMDAVLAAADLASDWASYTDLQGGPLVARRDLIVRLAYEITEQGNEYGEDVQRVQGIYSPHVQGSEVATRLVKWAIVPKLAEASAEAGFSGGAAAPWSSVNNCTGGTRRRLTIELQKRGFDGSDLEINALLRGSSLALGYGRALIYRNGELRERHPQPENESWPGWA